MNAGGTADISASADCISYQTVQGHTQGRHVYSYGLDIWEKTLCTLCSVWNTEAASVPPLCWRDARCTLQLLFLFLKLVCVLQGRTERRASCLRRSLRDNSQMNPSYRCPTTQVSHSCVSAHT